MQHKSFLVHWPDGTVSIVGAASFQELSMHLDAYGDPATAQVCEIEQGTHFHLKPKHKNVEPLDGDEALWFPLLEAEFLFLEPERCPVHGKN